KRLAPSSNHKEGQIQSPGRHVLPASLYAQQLHERHTEQPNPTPTPAPTSTGKPDPNPTETGKPDDPTPTPTQSEGGGAGDDKPTSGAEDPDGDLANTGASTPVSLLGGIAAALLATGAVVAWRMRRHRTTMS
ncbi:LPXTG cell wall anchor domain-containing protein, partial [Streptomyces chartreusis]|uniref:LPXTG cell wall anchor domain-containing protein n=1 Tax=Streptomyces chartreusis TaxID=1969 RepID=UPI00382EAF08